MGPRYKKKMKGKVVPFAISQPTNPPMYVCKKTERYPRGSENRDSGGIQWNSEPISPPAPLLKINTNYVGFSELSIHKNLERRRWRTLWKLQRFDQKRYNEPKTNRIPDFIVFSETLNKGLSRHVRIAILILGPVKGVRTSPSKWGVLTLKQHWIGHIRLQRAPMELIIGASCSSRPGLSEHMWVYRFKSRQNPGVTGGEPENSVLILNRDWIEHILPPCAPMELIIGASCSS